MRRKVYTLISIATALTICSCKTLSTHTSGYTADTLRITTLQYDSIIIDRQTSTTFNHDTIFVDRLKTECRYRTLIDTIYRSCTDTVYATTPLPPPPKYIFPILCLILCLCFVLKYRRV